MGRSSRSICSASSPSRSQAARYSSTRCRFSCTRLRASAYSFSVRIMGYVLSWDDADDPLWPIGNPGLAKGGGELLRMAELVEDTAGQAGVVGEQFNVILAPHQWPHLAQRRDI